MEISKLQIDNPVSNVINIDEIGKYYVVYLTERKTVDNINLTDIIREVEDDLKFSIIKNITKEYTYKLFNNIIQNNKANNDIINIDQDILNKFIDKQIKFKELISTYNLSKINDNINKKNLKIEEFKEKELVYIYEKNNKFIIKFLYKIQYPNEKTFLKIYKKYEKLIKWNNYIAITKSKYKIMNNINIIH